MVLQWSMADELGPEYFGNSGDDALNGCGFNPWEPNCTRPMTGVGGGARLAVAMIE